MCFLCLLIGTGKKSLEQTNFAKGIFRSRQIIRLAMKYNYRTCVYLPCVLTSFLTPSSYSHYWCVFAVRL